jgi:hypothetical protein
LDLRDLLTLLLGGWISDRANGGAATSPAIASVAARSQEKLHSETQAGTFDPFAIDTKLPLLGEYILSAQQAHTYQLRTSANPLANTLVELGRSTVTVHRRGTDPLAARIPGLSATEQLRS